MSLLQRQQSIRSADAALREVDLPLYADVVVSLHRLVTAVEKLSAQWPGEKPPNVQAQRVMHYAVEAKDLIACFQHKPVDYERMRDQARRETSAIIAFARKSAADPSRPDDDIPHIDDIDF